MATSKISENRILEIYTEAKRRMNLWLSHSTFDEMTVMGSQLRFDMALGLYGGYPFEKPEWMKDKAFNNFITESEFNTSEYQEIINQLFEKAGKN
ncbi:hypothetical protein [Flagellimonas halotolerans]|uniref:Uncharacterized protein n=1 Tax=Flagellimonas halotolerans TaxID=3112164 RepID=A0ABU6IQR4_9FLAO|nr:MULTISPECIES: hypothetical protein [unclassified Allomuricauda]MEC3965576.1 hypothetical protein [Muricauda sp. SYSU M86414]MEC4265442.1 hypothetical protein [Muricauda sp. SYSU M84420]